MRINVIPVEILADQHLRAEYGEIQNMMLPYYRRTMNSILVKAKGFDESRIPKDYTLSTGHATFFMNKFTFVQNRFESVALECRNRGFTTNLRELDISEISHIHRQDYTPTKQAMIINLERIKQRISLKPKWYKFHGYSYDMKDIYEKFEGELNAN